MNLGNGLWGCFLQNWLHSVLGLQEWSHWGLERHVVHYIFLKNNLLSVTPQIRWRSASKLFKKCYLKDWSSQCSACLLLILFLYLLHCKQCTPHVFVKFCFPIYFHRCHLWLQRPQNPSANIFCPYATNKFDIRDSISFIYTVIYFLDSSVKSFPKNEGIQDHKPLFLQLAHTVHIITQTYILFLKSSWRCTLSSWPRCWALRRCRKTAPCLSATRNCVILQQHGLSQTPRSLPGQPGTSAAAVQGWFSTEQPPPAAPCFSALS